MLRFRNIIYLKHTHPFRCWAIQVYHTSQILKSAKRPSPYVLSTPPHLAITVHHGSHSLQPAPNFTGGSLWPATLATKKRPQRGCGPDQGPDKGPTLPRAPGKSQRQDKNQGPYRSESLERTLIESLMSTKQSEGTVQTKKQIYIYIYT